MHSGTQGVHTLLTGEGTKAFFWFEISGLGLNLGQKFSSGLFLTEFGSTFVTPD